MSRWSARAGFVNALERWKQARWWPAEPKPKRGECAFKAYHRRTGITLGAHVFRGVMHRDGSE